MNQSKIRAVVVFQCVLAIGALWILLIRAHNVGLMSGPFPALPQIPDTGPPPLDPPSFEPNDTFATVVWRVTSVFLMVFVPVAVAGSVGLIKRRDWGRRLSILSMGMALLFGILLASTVVSTLSEFSFDSILVEVVAPILLALALILPSIFSINFLLGSRVKEFFKEHAV